MGEWAAGAPGGHMSKSEREEILHEIEALPQEQRKLVLDVARALAGKGGKSARGEALLRLAGSVPKSDLKRMAAVIEGGCETIDRSEW